MIQETQLMKIIRSSGLRMTRQRQIVLDVLRENPGHLEAEALHERVKARDPRIGLATVYRTLALLKRFGLVAEHRLGEEHGHFEATPAAPHYHFTCARCRKVIEFETPAVANVIDELIKQENVQVTEVHLLLIGRCATCREV